MMSVFVTLKCDVKSTVKKKAGEKLPKAFKKLDMGWYGFPNQIIMETLLPKDKLKLAQHQGVCFEVPYSPQMMKKLKSSTIHHYGLQDDKKEDHGWNDCGFYSSFDALSHLTDILFAAHHLHGWGHTPTIEYKSG
jgi:hypothetical protein